MACGPMFGGDYDRPRRQWDDGRDSIAVPITVDERVLGAINLTWIQKVAVRREIVARHINELGQAAKSIAARLSGATQPR